MWPGYGGRVVICVTAILIASGSCALAAPGDAGSTGDIAASSMCSAAFSRGWCGDGGPATGALLNDPHQVAPLATGGFLIADTGNNVVRRVDAAGVITTVAGTPMQAGDGGDGGPATSALLDQPMGVVDLGGGAFAIADTGNHVVRMVDGSGRITTLAPGFDEPRALARRSSGDVLVADAGLNQVFAISPIGVSTAVAGTGTAGSGGDGGPATAALLDRPTSVAVSSLGDILVADAGNRAVRRIGPDGTITTALALPGPPASSPVAISVAVAADGSLLVGDGALVVRASGDGRAPTPVAGTGISAFSGDDGAATDVALGAVSGVAPTADGSILVSDAADDRIRRASAAGQLTTAAGSGAVAAMVLIGASQVASRPPLPSTRLPANSGSCRGLRSSPAFRVSFPYAYSPIVVRRTRRHAISVTIYAAGNASLILTVVARGHRRLVVRQQVHTNTTPVKLGNLGPGTYALSARAARGGSYSCATDHLEVKP